MDFNDAIEKHVSWKMKLSAYLRNPDGSISANEVARDDLCDVGRWINTEGRAYAHLPEFARLVEAHRAFHQEASDVVRRAARGDKVTDEVALGARSAYGQVSTQTISLLRHLRDQAPGR